MTPETDLFIKKAKRLLDEAKLLYANRLIDIAGRTAYVSAFHAAQAYISELTGRVLKTHSGVHTEFARLTKDDASIAPELRSFLPRAYGMKAIADYETDPTIAVTIEGAARAIQDAEHFVADVERRVSATP